MTDTTEKTPDRKTGLEARTTIGNEMVRTLMWINGGGALALLALVPQVWEEHALLIPWLISGICFLAGGVLLTPYVNYARIDSSRAHEIGSGVSDREKAELRTRWRDLAKWSARCFFAGCVVVAVGMLVTFLIEYCPRLAAL